MNPLIILGAVVIIGVVFFIWIVIETRKLDKAGWGKK